MTALAEVPRVYDRHGHELHVRDRVVALASPERGRVVTEPGEIIAIRRINRWGLDLARVELDCGEIVDHETSELAKPK